MSSESDRCPPGLSRDLEQALPADPKLIARGWVRRYLADPDRAKEAIELYTSLGYEVKAQTLLPEDFLATCGDCASAVCQSYVMIYTREPGEKPAS